MAHYSPTGHTHRCKSAKNTRSFSWPNGNEEEYFSRVYFCNIKGHICILISLSSRWKKVTRILRDVNTLVSSQWKRPGPVEQLFTTILYPALFYSECVGKQKAIHQRDRLDYYQTKKKHTRSTTKCSEMINIYS